MVAKLSEIKKLLKILRENGVEEYKNGDIHVKLGARAFLSKPMIDITEFESKSKNNNNDEDYLYDSGV